MQAVYIDVYIFINIFENLLLLLAVKYILRLKTSRIRLTAGCSAGGALSLLSFINTIFILNILIKLCVAAIIVLITFGFKSKKLFAKTTATLIILTFLISGALICFYLAFKPNGMMIINDNVYFNISPLLLISLTLVIYFILILIKKLFKNHNSPEQIKDVAIQYMNRTYHLKCKVDSGLNAKEPFSGSSVIIADKNTLDITPNNNKMRIIPYNSLGGSGIIYGFKAEQIIIDNKIINEEIYVGLCGSIFNSGFNGLIPQNIFE